MSDARRSNSKLRDLTFDAQPADNAAAPLVPVSMRNALMIAYHFPPILGSSGVLRTLKFSRYLPEFRWAPTVLTTKARAYRNTGGNQLDEIPDAVDVHRVYALDATRDLTIRGRYPSFFAWPDAWASWWFWAVPAARRIITSKKPSVIWSTYPIATAHLIGLSIHRRSGLPWVADFRDSMTEENYPSHPRLRKIYRWIERQVMIRATRCVFTTPGTVEMYRARYPDLPEDRVICIPNGFDRADFSTKRPSNLHALDPARPITLVHSGLLYPKERNPLPFFEAVVRLRAAGRLKNTRVVLRASGRGNDFESVVDRLKIRDTISFVPPVPYDEAIEEMFTADGLLIFQAASCNHQIPAKLYEYFAAQRPILALTDSRGDTAKTMRDVGIDTIAQIDNSAHIAEILNQFVTDIRTGKGKVPDPLRIDVYSRREQTAALARIFDEVSKQQ